jgi:hypothetical protein
VGALSLAQFYQIMCEAENVYGIHSFGSSLLSRLLAGARVVVTLGLASSASVLECWSLRGYLGQLLLWSFVPLVLMLGILAGTLARLVFAHHRRPCSAATVCESALPWIMRGASLPPNLVRAVWPC